MVNEQIGAPPLSDDGVVTAAPLRDDGGLIAPTKLKTMCKHYSNNNNKILSDGSAAF